MIMHISMHIIWNAQVQQKMFAKNRCRVASFSLRCLRLSERFSKDKIFAKNECILRLDVICNFKWTI